MDNQGLIGALDQYWSIDEKPRLHRRNTFFDDVTLKDTHALNIGVILSTVAIAIIGFWCILGVIL